MSKSLTLSSLIIGLMSNDGFFLHIHMHTPATHISYSSLLLTSVGGVFARVVVVVGEDRDRCAAFILSLYAVHNATPILINYYYYSSKNNVNRFLP